MVQCVVVVRAGTLSYELISCASTHCCTQSISSVCKLLNTAVFYRCYVADTTCTCELIIYGRPV